LAGQLLVKTHRQGKAGKTPQVLEREFDLLHFSTFFLSGTVRDGCIDIGCRRIHLKIDQAVKKKERKKKKKKWELKVEGKVNAAGEVRDMSLIFMTSEPTQEVTLTHFGVWGERTLQVPYSKTKQFHFFQLKTVTRTWRTR